MHKPLLYFQFDKNTFEEKQYAPGKNYSYEENGFGNICYQMKDLISELQKIIDNGNKMDEKYVTRVNDYFAFFDRENCKRIFNAINT